MTKLLLTGMMFCLVHMAHAQTVEEDFKIYHGVNPSGSEYGGKVHTFANINNRVGSITWNPGTEDATRGIMMRTENRGAAYSDSPDYGLAMYTFSTAQSSLSGSWAMAATTEEVGEETILSFNPKVVVGSYDIQGTNPNGSAYTGTITITGTTAGYYNVQWNVGDVTTSGIALYEHPTLVIAFGPEDTNYGVVLYTEGIGGNLLGKWATNGGQGLGTEDMSPIE